MSDWMLLYLFTRLDAVKDLGYFMMLLGVLGATALLMVGIGDDRPEMVAWGKRLVAVPIIGLVLMVGVPTKKDMAIIVGGKIALDVGRSETAQQVGQEVLDAIRAQLKKAAQ